MTTYYFYNFITFYENLKKSFVPLRNMGVCHICYILHDYNYYSNFYISSVCLQKQGSDPHNHIEFHLLALEHQHFFAFWMLYPTYDDRDQVFFPAITIHQFWIENPTKTLFASFQLHFEIHGVCRESSHLLQPLKAIRKHCLMHLNLETN